jgi:hypothetical protein
MIAASLGKNTDDVGTAFDFLVEPLERIGAVQFAAMLLGEVEIRQHLGLAAADEDGEPFWPQLMGDVVQRLAGQSPIRLQEGLPAAPRPTMLCWVFRT